MDSAKVKFSCQRLSGWRAKVLLHVPTIIWMVRTWGSLANVANDYLNGANVGFSCQHCQRLFGWREWVWMVRICGSLASAVANVPNDYVDGANVGFSCQRSEHYANGPKFTYVRLLLANIPNVRFGNFVDVRRAERWVGEPMFTDLLGYSAI